MSDKDKVITILERVENLDSLIRQMEKLISKMYSGHFILAYRDANRIHSELKESRKELIKEQDNGK